MHADRSPTGSPRTLLWLLALGQATLFGWPLALVRLPHMDWLSHVWLAQVVADGIARAGWPPLFAEMQGAYGSPMFVYYGLSHYTLLAPLCWLFGTDLALRLAGGAALVAMARRVQALTWRATGRVEFAALAGPLLGSSVYAVTNLLARGALPEFLAGQLLGLALCDVVEALYREERRSRRLARGAVLGGLALLGHPPTLYLAALCLGPTLLALGIVERQRLVAALSRTAGLALMLVGAVLASFAWLVASTAGDTLIRAGAPAARLGYFPNTIDHPFLRLFPLPMDLRVHALGFELTSTPYLAAPVATPLLLVVVVALWLAWPSRGEPAARRAWWLSALALLGALLAIMVSLPLVSLVANPILPDYCVSLPGTPLSRLLSPIQYAYRLVGAANLALLLATLLLVTGPLRVLAQASAPKLRSLVFVAALVMALAAASEASQFATPWLLPLRTPQVAVAPEDPTLRAFHPRQFSEVALDELFARATESRRALASNQATFIYAAPKLFAAWEPDSTRPLLRGSFAGRSRGGVATLESDCAAPACLLLTDIVPSSFVHLRLDGRSLPRSELFRLAPPEPVLTAGSRREPRRLQHERLALALDTGPHVVEVRLGSTVTTAFALGVALLSLAAWGFGLAALFRSPWGFGP